MEGQHARARTSMPPVECNCMIDMKSAWRGGCSAPGAGTRLEVWRATQHSCCRMITTIALTFTPIWPHIRAEYTCATTGYVYAIAGYRSLGRACLLMARATVMQ